MLYRSVQSLMLCFLLLVGTTACGSAPAQEHDVVPAGEATSGPDNDHQGAAVRVEALAPAELAAGDRLRVVATTNIAGDIVRQVGGDLIDLTVMLPPGTDPHTFEPSPRDLTTVADAHLVFANGLGLEGFLVEMIENAGGDAALIYLTQGIEPRDIEEEEMHEGEEAGHHEEGEPESHGDIDPHTWTSPANAIIFVDNIVQALSSLDPANAEVYAENAQAYQHKLIELDAWVETQIESIPPENRKLVSDHALFGYYADRYGLEQIGAVIPGFSTNAEPSAQQLAALENLVKEHRVKALFVGNTVNPALSEQVAADTGTRLLRLYSGSLGPAGSGVESYLDYIRHNTETIVAGLK